MSEIVVSDYTVFDVETGRALSHTQRPSGETIGISGIVVAGRWDGKLYWMDEGIVARRPAALSVISFSVTANGMDVLSIPVPLETIVYSYFEGEHKGRRVPMRRPNACPDGVFEFVTAKVGTYIFDIEPPFPHRTQEITVAAIAP